MTDDLRPVQFDREVRPKDFAQEALERAEKATPGEWLVSDHGGRIEIESPATYVAEIDTSYDESFNRAACEADADFIAHAREDIPRLVRMVKAREEVVEATRILIELGTQSFIGWEPSTAKNAKIAETFQDLEAALARLAAEEER